MKRRIASARRITPATLKRTGMLKLKLRGGDLDQMNWGNCTPAPLTMSRKRYGTTAPTSKAAINTMRAIFMRMTPNDPSSATRPTKAHDCNLDAMAGFAAAHG